MVFKGQCSLFTTLAGRMLQTLIRKGYLPYELVVHGPWSALFTPSAAQINYRKRLMGMRLSYPFLHMSFDF